MTKQRNSGFTLMELLIAMFVFSLLSAFAFGAISMLSRAGLGLQNEQQSLADMEKAFSLLEGDIRRGNSLMLQEIAPVPGEEVVEVLEVKVSGSPRSVQFYFVGDAIYREVIQSGGENAKTKLLGGMEGFGVNLNDSSLDQSSGGSHSVEVTLQHGSLGAVSRVIRASGDSLMGYDYSQLSGHLRPPPSSDDAFSNPPSETTLSDDDMDVINSL